MKERTARQKRTSAHHKKYRQEIRHYILSYYKSHPCSDCGESDPVTLQFDHVRGEKKFAVGSFSTKTLSLNKVKDEIDKCEVVCANCHARRTAKSQNWYDTGVDISSYRK